MAKAAQDQVNRKTPYQKRNFRLSPYQRPENYSVNAVQDQRVHAPAVEEYEFSVNIGGLLKRLEKLGDIVKWPDKYLDSIINRDPSRNCGFHKRPGHRTEDCIALKREVTYLVREGHL